jgi:hypothetical protein
MLTRLYAAAGLLVLLIASAHGFSQDKRPESQRSVEPGSGPIEVYMSALGPAIPVFQGAEWVRISQKAKGHPFFEKPTPVMGSLRYQGVLYRGLSMQYDIQQGLVLVLPEGDGLRLAIPREKLDGFSFDSTVFVKSSVFASAAGLSDTVFYRIVYPGPTTVLALHQKFIRDRPVEENSETYEEKVLYYILSDAQFHEVVSEKQLLALKGARNKSLRKLFSERQIRFRKNTEEALLIAAGYYDKQQ